MGFWRKYRFVLMAAGLFLAVVGLFSVNATRPEQGGVVEELVLEVLGPVQKAVSFVGSAVDGFIRRYVMLMGAERENEQLRRQVQALRQQLAQLGELRKENARLRALLKLTRRLMFPVVAAEVVGEDATGHFRMVIIDKGTADGLAPSMPVVHTGGVVGRVVWASAHYAKVLLITDPNSGVDVIVQRTRARGIVEGAGRRKLRVKYVLHTDDVAVGDKLVTSGAAGVFPKGLLVGVVTRVRRPSRGVFLEVEARASVDFDRLEEVLVILKRKRLEG